MTVAKAISYGSNVLSILLNQEMKQEWTQIASCIRKPVYGHLVATPGMVKLEML